VLFYSHSERKQPTGSSSSPDRRSVTYIGVFYDLQGTDRRAHCMYGERRFKRIFLIGMKKMASLIRFEH
jgi:hypothetical protein